MRRAIGLAAILLSLSISSHCAAQQAADVLPALRQAILKNADVTRDIVYRTAGKSELKLDLYTPRNSAKPFPVIVWIHGGGWSSGSKDDCPAIFFLPKGYAAVSVQYRLTQEAPFPAQIEDCKAAIRWLRANAAKHKLDPDRIGVWGASAGGHLAALLGTAGDAKQFETGEHLQYSSQVQAVCDWFGPADLTAIAARTGPLGREISGPLTALLGGPVEQKKDLAKQASPVTYVDKEDPPFLICHGDADPLVPLSQSQALEKALKKAGVEVELVVVKGAGHGFVDMAVFQKMAAFFDRHLQRKTD